MMLRDFGTEDQKQRWMEPLLQGELGWCWFNRGATAPMPPDGNLSRTHNARRRQRLADQWRENVDDGFTQGQPRTRFARHSGEDGSPKGIGFLTSRKRRGLRSATTCGPSTCPQTILTARSPMFL